MRSHNQTLLTGPSVCKSLTNVREGESGRREDERRRDTSIRRPHRFVRNVEYKLPYRFQSPVAIIAKFEENENLGIINIWAPQKTFARSV